MADPRQSPAANPHAATSEPVELGDGQLDGLVGGAEVHEDTVILQYGAIDPTSAAGIGGRASGASLTKVTPRPTRG
jgi:hypothetical protein